TNGGDMEGGDFPLWLRTTHLLNFILIGILIRSGWEIISSLPRLWWRNDCKPGTEWLKFTRRKLPKEEGVYTSLMDERSLHPLISCRGARTSASAGTGTGWAPPCGSSTASCTWHCSSAPDYGGASSPPPGMCS